MKKLLILTLALFLSISLYSQKQPSWKAPEKYKTMKSVKGDVVVGKELFSKNCKSCHGAKGYGDGVKAASLATFPGNFTRPDFQKRTDGEIYWISIIGQDEMPNFEKKFPNEADRWSLVSYMRTLK